MKTKFRRLTQGFTIIEVMIVLAIAGLILAIVFFAVPQLQRNARDNQRESYVTRLKAELDTYSSNNQGTYPFGAVGAGWTNCSTANATSQSCYDWYNRYINGKVNIKDPSLGSDATICYSRTQTALTAGPGTPGTCNGGWTTGMVWIAVGDKCSGENLTAGTAVGNSDSKQYAILGALDRSGTFYCVDNG